MMVMSYLVRLVFITLIVVFSAGCELTQEPTQTDTSGFAVPRDGYGNPDLNGIWQAMGSAHWDLEAHHARAGPIVAMGAIGAIPAGQSVVTDGEIPYQPWARKVQQENRNNWLTLDPAVKCYMPGIPRSTYMPFPFQIVQGPDHILITYEFANASRIVYMARPDFEHPTDAWMGHSRGNWEADDLVINVDSHVADTWLDSSGNFHSDALHVVERFSRTGPDMLMYEAEITDPKVFERPWKVRMPLYRRMEKNAQLMEFKCVEFTEELLYGHLRKQTSG